ncbi:TetR family transcriptional regulator [Saccharopolyspora terrae]|uniref:TetR family transcriptional regulator n=1 Tax=Saccharopolyspora terrae TaxID=2530384 RepID=A0A4R4VCW5_9PSEU|nr:TetR family transcriptional regulator C-terminal domain-containing protein [Saccharopolyspora terrae]TDD03338.1 TetR family transcriptional regulator [Saccharopolyspora terrae]
MPKIVDHESRRIEVAEAVWTVVQRDGINAASVRAVAAECGWTYGMIAHYFKNRDDLLLFAYRLALTRELERAPTAKEQPDPVERLVGLLVRALPIDKDASLDLRIWLGFMGRVADDPSLAKAVLGEHSHYHSAVLDHVHECFEAARVSTPLPAETLTRQITVYVDGLGIAATLDPDTYSADTLESTLRMFLQAMGFDCAT